MKFKSGTFAVKAVDGGSGTVVFATLNVIDRDGDFTLPGAFGNQTAKLVGAHDWGKPSIGLAKVREENSQAVADIEFNLDMSAAAEWYKSLKFNFEKGISQEFSYGFDVLEESPEVAREMGARRGLKKLKVHEVSPVMIGAGVDTRIQNLKSADLRMEEHGLQVMETVEGYLQRLKSIASIRQADGKEGREVSRANRERLIRLMEMLGEARAHMETFLTATAPKPVDDGKAALVNFRALEHELMETELKLGRLYGQG